MNITQEEKTNIKQRCDEKTLNYLEALEKENEEMLLDHADVLIYKLKAERLEKANTRLTVELDVLEKKLKYLLNILQNQEALKWRAEK